MKNEHDDGLEALGSRRQRNDPLDSLEVAPSSFGPGGGQSGGGEAKFNLLVGVLLILIIASLAALWMIERNRRVQAEQQLAQFEAQQGQAQMMLGKFALGGLGEAHVAAGPGSGDPRPGPAPVAREDLPSERVEMLGKDHTLFRVSASAGRRIGFQPGDIVVVSDAPPAPATAPAGPPPGPADKPAEAGPESPAATGTRDKPAPTTQPARPAPATAPARPAARPDLP